MVKELSHIFCPSAFDHTYHFSEKSVIKQHLIIKHNNSTNQLTSSDVRKILTDNTMIIYKNNNKNGYKSWKQYA